MTKITLFEYIVRPEGSNEKVRIVASDDDDLLARCKGRHELIERKIVIVCKAPIEFDVDVACERCGRSRRKRHTKRSETKKAKEDS